MWTLSFKQVDVIDRKPPRGVSCSFTNLELHLEGPGGIERNVSCQWDVGGPGEWWWRYRMTYITVECRKSMYKVMLQMKSTLAKVHDNYACRIFSQIFQLLTCFVSCWQRGRTCDNTKSNVSIVLLREVSLLHQTSLPGISSFKYFGFITKMWAVPWCWTWNMFLCWCTGFIFTDMFTISPHAPVVLSIRCVSFEGVCTQPGGFSNVSICREAVYRTAVLYLASRWTDSACLENEGREETWGKPRSVIILD